MWQKQCLRVLWMVSVINNIPWSCTGLVTETNSNESLRRFAQRWLSSLTLLRAPGTLDILFTHPGVVFYKYVDWSYILFNVERARYWTRHQGLRQQGSVANGTFTISAMENSWLVSFKDFIIAFVHTKLYYQKCIFFSGRRKKIITWRADYFTEWTQFYDP